MLMMMETPRLLCVHLHISSRFECRLSFAVNFALTLFSTSNRPRQTPDSSTGSCCKHTKVPFVLASVTKDFCEPIEQAITTLIFIQCGDYAWRGMGAPTTAAAEMRHNMLKAMNRKWRQRKVSRKQEVNCYLRMCLLCPHTTTIFWIIWTIRLSSTFGLRLKRK